MSEDECGYSGMTVHDRIVLLCPQIHYAIVYRFPQFLRYDHLVVIPKKTILRFLIFLICSLCEASSYVCLPHKRCALVVFVGRDLTAENQKCVTKRKPKVGPN